jgi:hypothetical protein
MARAWRQRATGGGPAATAQHRAGTARVAGRVAAEDEFGNAVADDDTCGKARIVLARQVFFTQTRKVPTMKEIAGWRSARVASLVPNVLPKAEAAACIGPRECWCYVGSVNLASCSDGAYYCTTCYGRAAYQGRCWTC